MLRFFYWPAVGPDITEERRKRMENEEQDPFKSMYFALYAAEKELQQIMKQVHESYRALTIHSIDVQGCLHHAQQALYAIEKNERPS